jgi:hypothetical protein
VEIISNLDVGEPLVYRRATIIIASGHQVSAEMEDDFHHFRITLGHDGDVVTGIVGESIRYPWTTCGLESERKIQDLAGCRLDSMYEQLSSDERFSHCTHMFDLVQLAIGHAAKTACTRLYQATVTLLPDQGPVRAELKRDGDSLFQLDIENGCITGPAPYSGLRVDGLAAWASAQEQDELVEAVLVLKRAIHVSLGKIFDWSNAKMASEMNLPPTCYTFQPATAQRSIRVPDSIRDYTHNPEQMLGGKNIT